MSDDYVPPPAAPATCVQPGAFSLQSTETLQTIVANLQQELMACQRLALLGSMSAMVVHEFNNLLTPILARVEAAVAGPADGAFMRKTLERVLVQAQRAQTVTRRLLDLAHDVPRPTEACALAEAVQEAIATLTRPLDKDGIELRVAVPEDLLVCARPDLLCQVLLNLLLNARRAMQGRTGRLTISAAARGDLVQIDVRDTGSGLSTEILDGKINPFLAADPYQHPDDWQQVGLGLSVCRLIAHHHGATLRGLANDDGGCTFRLRWPKASAFRPEPRRAGGRC